MVWLLYSCPPESVDAAAGAWPGRGREAGFGTGLLNDSKIFMIGLSAVFTMMLRYADEIFWNRTYWAYRFPEPSNAATDRSQPAASALFLNSTTSAAPWPLDVIAAASSLVAASRNSDTASFSRA